MLRKCVYSPTNKSYNRKSSGFFLNPQTQNECDFWNFLKGFNSFFHFTSKLRNDQFKSQITNLMNNVENINF